MPCHHCLTMTLRALQDGVQCLSNLQAALQGPQMGMRRKNSCSSPTCGQHIQIAPWLPKPSLVGCCLLLGRYPGAGSSNVLAARGDFNPPALVSKFSPQNPVGASAVPLGCAGAERAAGRGAGNGSPHPAHSKPSRPAKTSALQ